MPDNTQGVASQPVWLKIKSWLLNQRIPVIAGPLRRASAQNLFNSAQAGSPDAVRSLILAWLKSSDPDWREALAGILSRINHTNALDPFWEAWAHTRYAFLLDQALRFQKPAARTSPAFVLSLLVLNRLDVLKKSGVEVIFPLIQALNEPEPHLRETARQALLALQREDAIRELCTHWLRSRLPALEAILAQAGYLPSTPPELTIPVALKFGHTQVVLQAGAEQMDALISARQDPDPQISSPAAEALLGLQNPSGITALCERWAASREVSLADILIKARYIASKPFGLRLLTAMKSGKVEIAENIAPAHLQLLIDLLKDPDPIVSGNAQASLGRLSQPKTQTAFCQIVLDTDDAQLREVAIQAAYAPADPSQRAVFLFLTRQWSAYDQFDFDHRHLRLVYTTAPSALRQRISQLVQQVGRTDYLNILAGLDLRQISTTQDEVGILFRILSANREWEKLWNLVGWVDLTTSVQIVRALSSAGWKPQADREDFDRLSTLAAQEMLTNGPELTQALPPAVRRSVVKVNGRINDVNFHPSEPILAIGTSHPRLVLWDFHHARVARAIDGFDHSINLVVYGANGQLYCGQRGNTQARCSIYLLKDGLATFLAGHTGSVTALLPINETQLLSTGRDQQVILWDTSTQQPTRQTQFEFWPRSAALSNDKRKAVLLHSSLNLLALPDLAPIPYFSTDQRGSQIRPSVARCAVFSPDDKHVVTGQFNGQVICHTFQTNTPRAERRLLVTHPAPIEGLHFLPEHQLLVTACGDGLIAFTDWPSGKPRGSLMMHTHRLTSLHISPDGAFMATGGSEAAMVLWDLRVLDLPELFATPLPKISVHQIPVVASHASAAEIPLPIRNALNFLHLLLQRHYRYDVQIADAAVIQPGEFDILLQE